MNEAEQTCDAVDPSCETVFPTSLFLGFWQNRAQHHTSKHTEQIPHNTKHKGNELISQSLFEQNDKHLGRSLNGLTSLSANMAMMILPICQNTQTTPELQNLFRFTNVRRE